MTPKEERQAKIIENLRNEIVKMENKLERNQKSSKNCQRNSSQKRRILEIKNRHLLNVLALIAVGTLEQQNRYCKIRKFPKPKYFSKHFHSLVQRISTYTIKEYEEEMFNKKGEILVISKMHKELL